MALRSIESGKFAHLLESFKYLTVVLAIGNAAAYTVQSTLSIMGPANLGFEIANMFFKIFYSISWGFVGFSEQIISILLADIIIQSMNVEFKVKSLYIRFVLMFLAIFFVDGLALAFVWQCTYRDDESMMMVFFNLCHVLLTSEVSAPRSNSSLL